MTKAELVSLVRNALREPVSEFRLRKLPATRVIEAAINSVLKDLYGQLVRGGRSVDVDKYAVAVSKTLSVVLGVGSTTINFDDKLMQIDDKRGGVRNISLLNFSFSPASPHEILPVMGSDFFDSTMKNERVGLFVPHVDSVELYWHPVWDSTINGQSVTFYVIKDFMDMDEDDSVAIPLGLEDKLVDSVVNFFLRREAVNKEG